jgi:SAM-dependent methyltransferase
MAVESSESISRSCPICGSSVDQATLFLNKNIDSNKLSAFSFASRKSPEFMCHRLLKCKVCDVIYVGQPPTNIELSHAYHTADYDSAEEANDAANAYISAIKPTLLKLAARKNVLEIGTGTGIFLEHLAQIGFTGLVGIEPSLSAIAAAPDHRQVWIRPGMFNGTDFESESFDLICCFMTMEHVLHPSEITQQAYRLLKPGGAFVTVTHNYQSAVNRLLGRKSPIIDIEHMQLFCPKSLQVMFERNQFTAISIVDFVNTYSIEYWLRLMPLPNGLKQGVNAFLALIGVPNKKVSINVGNLISVGFK